MFNYEFKELNNCKSAQIILYWVNCGSLNLPRSWFLFFLSKSHYGIICIFLILLIKYCLNYPQASHLLFNLQGQQCYSTSVLILKLRFFSLFVTFCCCFIWKSDNFIDFFSKDQLFFLIFLVLISLISTFHYFLNFLCVVSIWFHVSFFLIL